MSPRLYSLLTIRNGPTFGKYRWDSNKFNGRASCRIEGGPTGLARRAGGRYGGAAWTRPTGLHGWWSENASRLGPGRETGNERRIHRLDRIRRDSIRAWKGDDRDEAHVLVRECEEERRNTDTYRFLGIRNLVERRFILYFCTICIIYFIYFFLYYLLRIKFLFLYLCNWSFFY